YSVLFASPSTFTLVIHHPLTHSLTLPLHDALPISQGFRLRDHARRQYDSAPARTSRIAKHRDLYLVRGTFQCRASHRTRPGSESDRKSTRLNSSHQIMSYAVF